jgi:protease-4
MEEKIESPGALDTAPAAVAPAAPAKPKRGAWPWLLAISIALALLLLCSCVWLVVLVANDSGTGASGLTGDGAVAVIYIDSQIAGVGGSSALSAASVTPERIIGELKKAADDDSVKAVILRIDSPGGTASASWEIAREVARFEKPIIASCGDMCASGAYMIASQCDAIIGTPSSDIGSIGVIMQVADLSELMQKLGIKYDTIHQGKYKDAGSPDRPLTDEERAMLDRDSKMVYEQFIKLVADGRKMSVADVRELATGWAWPGEEAKRLGLIDDIGNYRDAVTEAAKRGKIEGEPRIITYRSDSFQELLSAFSSVGSLLAPAALNGQPAPVVPR